MLPASQNQPPLLKRQYQNPYPQSWYVRSFVLVGFHTLLRCRYTSRVRSFKVCYILDTNPDHSDCKQLQAYKTATVTLGVVLGVLLLLLLLAARNKMTVKKMLGAWLAE